MTVPRSGITYPTVSRCCRIKVKQFFQFRGEGLKVSDGVDWKLLLASCELITLIHTWVQMGDGAQLGLASNGKWWWLDNHSASIAKLPLGMLSAANFSCGLNLADSSLALISDDGSTYLIDPGMRFKHLYKLDLGYLSGIYVGHDGRILIAADHAI